MNRRMFVGGSVVAAASVSSVLTSTAVLADPPSEQFRALLEELYTLARDYFGPSGFGELDWFTESGPNEMPLTTEFLGSQAFTDDLLGADAGVLQLELATYDAGYRKTTLTCVLSDDGSAWIDVGDAAGWAAAELRIGRLSRGVHNHPEFGALEIAVYRDMSFVADKLLDSAR